MVIVQKYIYVVRHRPTYLFEQGWKISLANSLTFLLANLLRFPHLELPLVTHLLPNLENLVSIAIKENPTHNDS